MLEIEVWDRDTSTENDMVCSGSVALAPVFEKKKTSEWYSMSYKGKHAGQLLIDLEFTPDHGNAMIGVPIQAAYVAQVPSYP
jgi:hypothetical protein